MKKCVLCLGCLVVTVGSPLFAASTSNGGYKAPSSMMQAPDCSQLTQDEQNFAAKIMDMNNKKMFCSQFSPQQRQQAMRMNGQMDTSGNMMGPDQAVQKAMGATPKSVIPSTQQKSSSGGCPVQ
jgi:hypothetical protein